MKNDELVLCITKYYYEEMKKQKGADMMSISKLISQTGYFDKRGNVEQNNKILQIIPYVVLTNKNKVYATYRIGGDERLQHKIGFLGGHVNRSDCTKLDGFIYTSGTLSNCIERELKEETNFASCGANIIFHDFFYDDSNFVSSCHLCLLVQIELSDEDANNLQIRETDKLIGQWYTPKELLQQKDNLENWCSTALDMLVDKKALRLTKKNKKNKSKEEN